MYIATLTTVKFCLSRLEVQVCFPYKGGPLLPIIVGISGLGLGYAFEVIPRVSNITYDI